MSTLVSVWKSGNDATSTGTETVRFLKNTEMRVIYLSVLISPRNRLLVLSQRHVEMSGRHDDDECGNPLTNNKQLSDGERRERDVFSWKQRNEMAWEGWPTSGFYRRGPCDVAARTNPVEANSMGKWAARRRWSGVDHLSAVGGVGADGF